MCVSLSDGKDDKLLSVLSGGSANHTDSNREGIVTRRYTPNSGFASPQPIGRVNPFVSNTTVNSAKDFI